MTKNNNVLIFAGSGVFLSPARGIYKIAAVLGQARPAEASKSATILAKAPSELKETAKIGQVAHLVVASGGRWHIANASTKWTWRPAVSLIRDKAQEDGWGRADADDLRSAIEATDGTGLGSGDICVRDATLLGLFASAAASGQRHRVAGVRVIAAVI